MSAFETPLMTGSRSHRIKVIIGAAVFPAGGRTADELLCNAISRCAAPRPARRGGHVLFEHAIRRGT